MLHCTDFRFILGSEWLMRMSLQSDRLNHRCLSNTIRLITTNVLCSWYHFDMAYQVTSVSVVWLSALWLILHILLHLIITVLFKFEWSGVEWREREGALCAMHASIDIISLLFPEECWKFQRQCAQETCERYTTTKTKKRGKSCSKEDGATHNNCTR